MAQQHEDWIDSAKGFAILLVIVGHVNGGVYGLINLRFVYAIHLTTFFILSGYTLKPTFPTKAYIEKKLKRLMIPYIVTCCAIIVMDLINLVHFDHIMQADVLTFSVAKDIIRSFFASGARTDFTNINVGARIGAIWFLPAMFFALIITQFVLLSDNNYSIRFFQAMLMFIMAYISARYIWMPYSIQSALFAVIFILIGRFFRENNISLNLNCKQYLLLMILFLIGNHFGYAFMGYVDAWCPNLIFAPAVSVIGACLLIAFAKKVDKNRYINFLGKNSLNVLCMHLFSMETMGRYYQDIVSRLKINNLTIMWIAYLFLEILFASGMTRILLSIREWFARGYRINQNVKIFIDEMKQTVFLLVNILLLCFCNVSNILKAMAVIAIPGTIYFITNNYSGKVMAKWQRKLFVACICIIYLLTIKLEKSVGIIVLSLLLGYFSSKYLDKVGISKWCRDNKTVAFLIVMIAAYMSFVIFEKIQTETRQSFAIVLLGEISVYILENCVFRKGHMQATVYKGLQAV